jgi:hypothetical protein
VLEQLARVVNAQARAAFARARARSGVLPNGRTLLGSVLDPLGLFKASGLVTTDADDARVIAATDALAEIIARAGVQGGGTGGLDVGALSQRELQQVAQSVARKLWARRGAARATSSRCDPQRATPAPHVGRVQSREGRGARGRLRVRVRAAGSRQCFCGRVWSGSTRATPRRASPPRLCAQPLKCRRVLRNSTTSRLCERGERGK